MDKFLKKIAVIGYGGGTTEKFTAKETFNEENQEREAS